jgi:hypothetical protein
MKKSIILSASCAGLMVASLSATALPNPDTHGWTYFAAVHESALYNNNEIYRKDGTNQDWWSDNHLNTITNARYDAIDRPMVDAVTDMIVEGAAQEGLDIKYKNIYTSGTLTASFTPASANNTLNFTINGISLYGYAKVEKSWYAEGFVRFDVNNISISGQYDYFNGTVDITDFNAPLNVDVDVDLNIPLLDIVLDPLLDNYVDNKVDSVIPPNLNTFFKGGSYSFFGIENYIPLNKLMHGSIDLGMVARDKLSQTSIINDNFSFSVGNIVVHKQSLSLTIGNTTYKRWTTGGRKPCQLGQGNDCGL